MPRSSKKKTTSMEQSEEMGPDYTLKEAEISDGPEKNNGQE